MWRSSSGEVVVESISVGGVGASRSEWRVLASSTSDSGVHRGHDGVAVL